MSEWKVTVRDVPKGEVFKKHARWTWSFDKRGAETWPKSAKRDDVLAFIARVCRADPTDVKLSR